MGTVTSFPESRVRRVIIIAGETHDDILIARHKRRIAGRYCQHVLSSRAGFVDDVQMRDGEIKALLSRPDGALEWFTAEDVAPTVRR